jgi:hypothetical protein
LWPWNAFGQQYRGVLVRGDRCLWYRLRLTAAEMNYATRRMVELQGPWISDDHPSH